MNQSKQSATTRFLMLLVFSFNLLLSLAVFSADAKRTLNVDDLSAIKNVSGPQISPDGLWVAYTLTEVDSKADVTRSDIWLTRWDGSETKQLTDSAESEHTPRWSPDGQHLAFLSTGIDLDTVDQLWLIEPKTSKLQRVTSLANGISDFNWGPDSRSIVMISDVIPLGSGVEPDGGPLVIDRMLFKRDAYGYLGKARSRLHLLDFTNPSVVHLTTGPLDEILLSFSPDGTRIAYVTT